MVRKLGSSECTVTRLGDVQIQEHVSISDSSKGLLSCPSVQEGTGPSTLNIQWVIQGHYPGVKGKRLEANYTLHLVPR